MRIAAIVLFIARVVRRWCDRTTVFWRVAGAIVPGSLRVAAAIVLRGLLRATGVVVLQGVAARHGCGRAAGGRKKELRTTNVKGAAEYSEGGVAYWAFNVKLAITLHCFAAGNVTK